jgi:hypothetical protein
MPRTNALALLALPLSALRIAGCARPARTSPVPMSGAQLERVAELPASPGGSHGATPEASFAGACGMRLRDAGTGREYLLVRSQIGWDVARTDSTTTTRLTSAVGEYVPVATTGREQPSTSPLRVDCRTSRVLPTGTSGTERDRIGARAAATWRPRDGSHCRCAAASGDHQSHTRTSIRASRS